MSTATPTAAASVTGDKPQRGGKKGKRGKGRGGGEKRKSTDAQQGQGGRRGIVGERKWKMRHDSGESRGTVAPVNEEMGLEIDRAFVAGMHRTTVREPDGRGDWRRTFAVDFLRMSMTDANSGEPFTLSFDGPTTNPKPDVVSRQHFPVGPVAIQPPSDEAIASKAVFEEYESMKAACLKKFSEMLQECTERAVKFEDEEFPYGPWALWRNPPLPCQSSLIPHPHHWRRATELFRASTLFGGAKDDEVPDPRDVEHGALGDSFFLGPLASLALRPPQLRSMFVASSVQVGMFAVALFFCGRWSFTIVDDFIPCSASDQPLFARNRERSRLWVAIAEKAYAKMYGCYESISHHGNELYAFHDLFGCVPNITVNLTEPPQESDPSNTKAWQLLSARFKAGSLLTCVIDCDNDSKGKTTSKGLLMGRCHMIHKILDADGLRLIQIFNPYGREQWTGKWADNDPIWREKLHLREKLSHVLQNDGLYCMEWADFLKSWTSVSISQPYERTMSVTRVDGVFDVNKDTMVHDLSGGEAQWHRNPQYGLTISETATTVYITAVQPCTKIHTGDDDYPLGIGLRLCLTTRAGKWNVADPLECIVLHSAAVAHERMVTLEAKLAPQDDPYTIVVSCSGEGAVMPFTMSIAASHQFVLKRDTSVAPGLFATALMEPPHHPFVDLFEEWIFTVRPQIAELTAVAPQALAAKDRGKSGIRPSAQVITPSKSPPPATQSHLPKAPLLQGVAETRLGQAWSKLVSHHRKNDIALSFVRPAAPENWAQRHSTQPQLQQQQQQQPHVCRDGVCVDFSKRPFWNEIHVSVVPEEHDESVAPLSEERFHGDSVFGLIMYPDVEAFYRFLEEKGAIKDRNLVRMLMCQGPGGVGWRKLRTFEDLVAGTTSARVLEVRVACILPHPPAKLEFASATIEEDSSLSAIIAWKAPAISDTSPAPLSFVMSVKIQAADFVGNAAVSDAVKLEVKAKPGVTNYAVKAKNMQVTRNYEFTVNAVNVAGKGDPSPALVIGTSDMLSRSYITVFGSHRGASLCAIATGKTAQQRTLFTGSRDHSIISWDVSTKTMRNTFNGHNGAVYCLAADEESGRLFSGSEDKDVRCWDAATGKCITTIGCHKAPVLSLCIHGKKLYSGGADDRILTWDIGTLSCLTSITLRASPCSMRISGARTMFVGFDNGMIDVCDIGETTITKKTTLSLHPSAITSLFVLPPSDLFSSCLQGFVRRWDTNTGSYTWERRAHGGPINEVTSRSDVIYTASFDGSIGLTDAIRGRTISKLPLAIGPLQFLIVEEGTILTGTASGAVIAVRLPEEILRPSTSSSKSKEFAVVSM